MKKARAEAKASVPKKKSEEDLPEWVRLVNKYAELKKKSKRANFRNNVKKNASPDIHRDFRCGMYGLVLKRFRELEEQADPKTKIIRFPKVFEKICRCFSISKRQAWDLLFMLNDLGMITLVPYQGIRINDKHRIAKALLAL